MPTNAPLPHSRSREPEESRWSGWLLLLPLPFAVLAIATVHPWPRAIMASALGLVGLFTILRSPPQRSPGAKAALAAPLLLSLALLSALPLLPLPADLRAALQPGLEPLRLQTLELEGLGAAPLAIDLARASLGWSWLCALALYGLAAATTLRSQRRSLRSLRAVALTAFGTSALARLFRATDASSIWWSSGIPDLYRVPFYGTFVNPNHAGVLLSAALPLCLGLAAPHKERPRPLWLAAAALLFALCWSTGSRGALLAAALGAALSLLLHAWERLARPAAGLSLIGIFALAAVGPREIALRLSRWILPESLTPDVFGDRASMWQSARDLVSDAPLVGVGIGGFMDGAELHSHLWVVAQAVHAHNEPAQALAELGLPLGLFAIGLLLWPLLLNLRAARQAAPGSARSLPAALAGAQLTILLACLYDFPMRIGALSLLAALLAGLSLARADHHQPAAMSWRRPFLASALLLALPALAAPALVWRLPSTDLLIERSQALPPEDPATLALIQQALRQAPLSGRAMLESARLLHLQGEGAQVFDRVELATQLSPHRPQSWATLARLRRKAGDLEGARKAWTQALRPDIEPDATALEWVEEALARERDPDVAAAILPDRADRLREGGRTLARRPSAAQPGPTREAARRLFERALALEPQAPLVYARHRLQWGEAAEARQLAASIPPTCESLKVIAQASDELDGSVATEAAWQKAGKRCPPDDPDVRLGRARALAEAGDPKAIPLIEAALEDRPEAIGLRRQLITILSKEGRNEDCVPHLEAIVLSGKATLQDLEALDRLYAGLPMQRPGESPSP